jgi:hypothetical protein
MVDTVYFECVSEGGKLRVRIIDSKIYSTVANCQFPRAGQIYSAPSSAVKFARGSAGTVFYRVSKGEIKCITGAIPSQTIDKVYDVGDTECIVCMSEDSFFYVGHN